jgi:hypothetical protein
MNPAKAGSHILFRVRLIELWTAEGHQVNQRMTVLLRTLVRIPGRCYRLGVQRGFVAVACLMLLLRMPSASQPQNLTRGIPLDPDDIGGIVASLNGPEAGVWVIAETTDLPTPIVKIVVTDDQGRYLLPDLPKAAYRIWTRGYGLVDSKPIDGRPGQLLDLAAVPAPNRQEAAKVFPAAYWLSMLRVPTTGPIGQADLSRALKSCMACHQLGDKATRDIPALLGPAKSHLELWDRRVAIGQSGAEMAAAFHRLGDQRSMLAEWTQRIAAGELPNEMPARPQGVERTVVITMWDWGEATTVVSGEAAGDPRNDRLNANGRVWGTGTSQDTLLWLDPNRHTVGAERVPSTAPLAEGARSPHFGEQVVWRAAAEPESVAIDDRGRVWLAAKQRPDSSQPAFCTSPANRFAADFPLPAGTKQVTFYDPASKQFAHVDTCFTARDSRLASDDKIVFGIDGGVGWIDLRRVAGGQAGRPLDSEAVQGWCPAVLDTNGDGQLTRGWTEPDAAVDPKKDHRIRFSCTATAVAPDGAIWCAPGSESDDRIVRLELGANPPQTCRAEMYQVPPYRDARGARGVDVDSRGQVWVNMVATDQFAIFDRSRCKSLNDSTGTGRHCAEGWKFYQIPGPPFSGPWSPGGTPPTPLQGRGTARTTDMMYFTTVDRVDVLGLNDGRDVPFAGLANGDALLAMLPQANEMIVLRVPYPLGFFARSLHGRIDDPAAGWKGRAVWSGYASSAPWHAEGGPGTKNKVVKFQVRPNPLAK